MDVPVQNTKLAYYIFLSLREEREDLFCFPTDAELAGKSMPFLFHKRPLGGNFHSYLTCMCAQDTGGSFPSVYSLSPFYKWMSNFY